MAFEIHDDFAALPRSPAVPGSAREYSSILRLLTSHLDSGDGFRTHRFRRWTMPVDLLARLAKELENVSYFKIVMRFAATSWQPLIEPREAYRRAI